MNESHKILCENLFQSANSFLKDYGYVQQCFFILKDNIINVLVLPEQLNLIEDEDYRKRAEFSVAMKACKDMQGDVVLHLSEAWIVDGLKEELDNFKGKPHEHPNRKEAVNIMYLHTNGERKLLSGEIIKLSDSNQRILKEPQWITITDIPLLEEQSDGHVLH